MPEVKNHFRASNGLDAAGEKVINVAIANRSVMTDGVNVEYLIQENTVQPYDPERGYRKDFVVTFNGRLWKAEQDIAKPAGPFSEGFWRPIRTDPKWKPINSGTYQLQIGDYISVDTAAGTPVEFTLPSNAQEGDNIVVRDVGGRPGFTDVIFKAGIQSIIDKGNKLKETRMTIPYSEWVFVYINKLWSLYNGSEADLGRYVRPGTIDDIQAGETIIRQYDTLDPIVVRFPKNAVNGDMIHFVGMNETTTPYFHLELNSFDDKSSVIIPGLRKKIFQRSLSGYFIYHAETLTWKLYDSDITDRLRTVSSNTNLFPNETVSVVGTNNTDVSDITLTLPQNVEPGDQITVALNYMRLGQTVNIVPSGPDKILTNKTLTQFPKRSDYPPGGNWINVTKLTYNGATDYPPIITFAYIPMGPAFAQWMVVENVPALERVDPSTDANRTRLGVIALANQAQANLNHEQIDGPAKEVAITAETLANRTANKTRRGIARISTDPENQLPTDDGAYLDDVIVSPKMLNSKQAREDMRGLAEIATQAEANGSTDDSRIITAKKLDARRANEGMAGVAKLVEVGAVAPVKNGTNTRDSAGTKIYNFADHERIVTPKVLREWKSTDLALGAVYLATSNEVIAGTTHDPKYPLAVTPEGLHTKTATEERIGFSEIATQAETDAGVDDFRFVTPKKLNDRRATEGLTGIAKLATQQEFDDGLAYLISEPSKIKAFFGRPTRTAVVGNSGLRQSGNLWQTTTFDIVPPTTAQRGTTTLATQAEVDKGTVTDKIVTPATLMAKKATEGAEGIIKAATDDETKAGTARNLAVTPGSLKFVIQDEITWEATNTRRGTVKLSDGALTWAGTPEQGSTKPLDEYAKTGYAISPYELNKTLANYLPIRAKAVDSDLLDGIDSTQFVRRDIDQTVNGVITFANDIVANKTASIKGLVNLGAKNDGAVATNKVRLSVIPPTHGGIWNHTTYDTTNDALYKLQYNDQDVATFKHNGETTLQTLTVGGSTTTNTLSVATRADVGSTLYVGGKLALTSTSSTLQFGSTGYATEIRGSDANATKLTDASGSYSILTEKNVNTIVDRAFVKKAGDTMTGGLNVMAPVTARIDQSLTKPTLIPNAQNFGSWTSDISDPAIYQLLPKYVVPVFARNVDTGEELPWVDHYDEFIGPGTLTQHSPYHDKADGSYQMWAVRPPVIADRHLAATFYVRQWNKLAGKWEGWGRVFTNNTPPLASDIGAMTNNGSIFDTMRIRDWIQIGNLRISANPVTKAVQFDWID